MTAKGAQPDRIIGIEQWDRSLELGCFRLLRRDEIATLVAQHNHAIDWQSVHIGKHFNLHQIRGCLFEGQVYIEGGVANADGGERALALHNSTIRNCVLHTHARLLHCPLVAGYRIGAGSVVRDSTLQYRGSHFATGSIFCAVPESDERAAPLGLEYSFAHYADRTANNGATCLLYTSRCV